MRRRAIVLIGPPGSGKGTQASLLASKLRIPAISTGNILRRECEAGTRLGNAVKALLAGGELVPDDLVNQVASRWISHPDAQRGFLLDGYPRTVPQAVHLDRLLEELGMPGPAVLEIDVPVPMLMKRLTGRLQCPACGRSYKERLGAPAHRGLCDDDGAPLVRRSDDSEPTIRERLRLYAESSAPVIEYYRGADLHRIDGTGGPGAVLEALESALGNAHEPPPHPAFPVSAPRTLMEPRTGGD